MSDWPWSELGIEETQDAKAIRKAYSTKLKQLDLDVQIDEYAALREARGYALYLAREGLRDDQEFADEEAFEDVPETLPDIESDDDIYAPFKQAREDAESSTSLRSVPSDFAEQDKEFAEAKTAWDRLGRLVFPNGEQSDDAFTLEEYEQAKSALQILLDRASSSSVSEAAEIDYNLSDVLAAGWPRSSPLVEAANEEFNWFAEVGSINERPALVFLNARLAGMRFHEAVQKPDHEYHKAWQDLESGTQPIWIRRLTLKRDKVLELLEIIRATSPELESFLDANRVEQWENATTSAFARWVQIFVIFWALQSALSYCTSDRSTSSGSALETEVYEQQEEHFEMIVSDLFGVEWTAARLRRDHSAFASRLQDHTNLHRFLNPRFDEVQGKDRARNFIRQRMLLARKDASFEQKVALLQLSLQIFRDARAQGNAACEAAMTWEDLTPSAKGSETPAPVYDGETELLIALLEEGKLLNELDLDERRWAIPGWLIGETIERSGLSEDQVRAGLRGDVDANRCPVIIALMESVASAPGKAPAELLTFP